MICLAADPFAHPPLLLLHQDGAELTEPFADPEFGGMPSG